MKYTLFTLGRVLEIMRVLENNNNTLGIQENRDAMLGKYDAKNNHLKQRGRE